MWWINTTGQPTTQGQSRGDVFVVKTSKPIETSEKMGYFDRVTVSLHILQTANQETEGSQDRLTVYNMERVDYEQSPIFSQGQQSEQNARYASTTHIQRPVEVNSLITKGKI